MSRELKFRAWDEKAKVMTTPCIEIVQHEENVAVLNTLPNYEGGFWFNKIMQYTGLKDMNGKDIYEGDIVEWVDEDIYPSTAKVRHKVTFMHNDTLGWDFGKLQKLTGDKLWISLVPDNMEVIGNIYENPDLIS